MAKEEKDKMMMLLLLSMMSMISGEEQKEPLMQMAASVSGLNPSMMTNGDKNINDGGVKYLHGIRQLADYLGVSIPTAQKYKDSGILDSAIRRVGRQFNFDAQKVDEVFNPQNK